MLHEMQCAGVVTLMPTISRSTRIRKSPLATFAHRFLEVSLSFHFVHQSSFGKYSPQPLRKNHIPLRTRAGVIRLEIVH